MRILYALVLMATMFACKTKSAIPSDQILQYVVILEESSTPKELKNEISFEIIDFSKMDPKINLWELAFKRESESAKNLKTSLLNHPKVISVLTLEEYNKIQQKKGKKPVEAPHGKGGVSKH